ncbi:gluconate 2-dehydrogenase subunit 3-like protein [Lutibacter oceani]|uniref:Gluconate 2-dehydrogenase subunit 3-like protein n=1 Tax=Lutibacter oceani TaxID=1853311 RepID=A0A3D9S486_9FLAO|nr:gluconate 2-dehydrogenase subunit 3 family protein [Lutibacter oceani]REE83382.1 gluconate 2-dehydrogenase subunit 3-like protein [Lutibacter oceani]
MKRRDALKKIGLGTGFVVATPSLISLLQSCTSDAATWTPTFFTDEQGIVITALVDIILPKTDTPSASEVNVPQFMDKYADEVLDIEEQNRMKTAFGTLVAHIKTTYNKNLSKVNEDNYKDLLDNQMLFNEPATPNDQPMTISDLLNSIKWSAINAYKISETVGETVLAYDPVPGAYYCGDLQELTGGKAYSL